MSYAGLMRCYVFLRSLLRDFQLLKCLAFFGFGVAGIAPISARSEVVKSESVNRDEIVKRENGVLPRLFFSSAERRILENPNQQASSDATTSAKEPENPPIINQTWYLNGIVQQAKLPPLVWINGELLSRLDSPFMIRPLGRQSVVFVDPKKIQSNTIVNVGETYQPGFVPSVTPNIHVKRH